MADLELIPQMAATPMNMVNMAVAQGASIDVLEKLLALQERWEANQARKAFDAAMSAAKAKMPSIGKDRLVSFDGGKGKTEYRYEDLAGIAKVVGPVLAENGLSYRFRTNSGPNLPVTVTCIITHRDGHSEENSLAAPSDATGNKNSIQAIGSTVTYLQRYTLKAALGLAASMDDDGNGAGVISNGQLAELNKLLIERKSDVAKFCEYMGVQSVAEIKAADFEKARLALNKKRSAPSPEQLTANAMRTKAPKEPVEGEAPVQTMEVPFDYEALLDTFREAANAATTPGEVEALWLNRVEPFRDIFPPGAWHEVCEIRDVRMEMLA